MRTLGLGVGLAPGLRALSMWQRVFQAPTPSTRLLPAKHIYQTCLDRAARRSVDRSTSSLSQSQRAPLSAPVCGLPDTFQSWFLVMHLDLYLVLVALKRVPNSDARALSDALFTVLWEDVEQRMRSLGVI